MQGKMTILYTDGTKTEKVYTGSTPELEDMQEAVDGWLEGVPVKSLGRGVLFANEEGLLRGLPFNEQASSLAGRPLVGNVVVLTGDKEFMDAL